MPMRGVVSRKQDPPFHCVPPFAGYTTMRRYEKAAHELGIPLKQYCREWNKNNPEAKGNTVIAKWLGNKAHPVRTMGKAFKHVSAGLSAPKREKRPKKGAEEKKR